MSEDTTTQPNPTVDNTEKDPDNWTTGDEPATGAQLSYIKTLSEAAGSDVPNAITKAEASKLIEELKAKAEKS